MKCSNPAARMRVAILAGGLLLAASATAAPLTLDEYYAAALCLYHLGRHDSLRAAADAVRAVLDNGAALERLTRGT